MGHACLAIENLVHEASARDELNLKRRGAQNTLMFCAQLLSKRGYKQKVAILVELSSVERRLHGEHVVMTKTQMGRFEFNLRMSSFAWLSGLAQSAALLHDPVVMRKCGFMYGDEVSHGLHDQAGIQSELAGQAFDFMVALLARRATALLMYNAPPLRHGGPAQPRPRCPTGDAREVGEDVGAHDGARAG